MDPESVLCAVAREKLPTGSPGPTVFSVPEPRQHGAHNGQRPSAAGKGRQQPGGAGRASGQAKSGQSQQQPNRGRVILLPALKLRQRGNVVFGPLAHSLSIQSCENRRTIGRFGGSNARAQIRLQRFFLLRETVQFLQQSLKRLQRRKPPNGFLLFREKAGFFLPVQAGCLQLLALLNGVPRLQRSVDPDEILFLGLQGIPPGGQFQDIPSQLGQA